MTSKVECSLKDMIVRKRRGGVGIYFSEILGIGYDLHFVYDELCDLG
jgi:hypothetical protein